MRALLACLILCCVHITATTQPLLLPADNPFDQVRVAGNIHLQLIASDTMQFEFNDEEIPKELNISWDEKMVTLKSPLELKKAEAINVKLYYTTLTALDVARGSVVQSADTLKTKTLSLRVDTGGKVELAISVDSLSARVSQGSDIILRGYTRSQQIQANSVGNFLGYELAANNTWVKATTGAQVKVNSTRFLNVNSMGGAFVGYLGTPEKREFKNSLGGDITQESP